MLSRSVVVLAVFALASVVRCDKTEEEPLSIATLFDNLNAKFQNATHIVEDILGVDIPSTKQEVETALQDNLKNLKESATKIQQKLAEYNVTSDALKGAIEQVQQQVNATVEDLAKKNPDVGKLLDQVKTAYPKLVDATQKVQKVVEEQSGSVTDELKVLAQQARSELSKATSQFEKRVQEVLAEKDKKTGKA